MASQETSATSEILTSLQSSEQSKKLDNETSLSSPTVSLLPADVPEKTSGDKELTPAYRDFLIFEERLKYSLKLLTFRQRQHFAMLITLSLLIVYFVWLVCFSSLETLWISICKGMLFILIAVLLLILNSEDINLPQRFSPRINRVLSEYGLLFNSNSQQVEVCPTINSTSTQTRQTDVEYRKYFQTGLTRFRTSFQKKAAAVASANSSVAKSRP